MDAFFASVEVRDDPRLAGKPVIVAGLSGRGVVCAASYEARTYGVHSAMPTFRARQLCPDGLFISPDMARYVSASREIHEVFSNFTPEIESIALDEAFLDITGSLRLFGSPEAIGAQVRSQVRERTGLAVSVGISETKLVAKIACSSAKPDGMRVVMGPDCRALLEPLPVRRLWGVGPMLEQKLLAAGLTTLGDLQRANPQRLRGLSREQAEHLIALAKGIDPRPVVSDADPKSIGEEVTFEQDQSARAVVSETLAQHADAVARRLRQEGFAARRVTLKVTLGVAKTTRLDRHQGQAPDYPKLTRARTLSLPTADAARLKSVALELYDALSLDLPLRLVGLSVSGLVPAAAEQLELFATPEQRGRGLGRVLDALEARYGPGVVQRGLVTREKITPNRQRKPGDD